MMQSLSLLRWTPWLCHVLTACILCVASGQNILDVTRLGVIGDGVHDDTRAMQHVISLAPPHSTVVVPSNRVVVTGPLTLSSDLTLQVDGTLQALEISPALLELDGWPKIPPVINSGASEDMGKILQYQALLYATNVTNLRITGKGVIDGRGEQWWQLFKEKSPLLQAGRGNLIQIVNSTHIEIDSVTLRDAPFWTLHPILCSFVYIHHITLTSRLYAPNVDGIDPDSCKHVLIEYNDVSNGDDHIAIKSGLCGKTHPLNCTDPVWSSGLFRSENITVRYNTFRVGMGIAIGSDTSGGVRDVVIHDNVIGICTPGDDNVTGCGWGPALHVKTRVSRGGVLENIVFRDNVVYNTSMFLLLEMNYQQVGPDDIPTDYAPTTIRNISFIGNIGLGSARAASFHCSEYDACNDINVVNNSIPADNADPWNCYYIKSYHVSGNTPEGLDDCMYHSMNRSMLASVA